MFALGQFPDPEGKQVVQLEVAHHIIDMLGVLEEKTKGNLSQHEYVALNHLLHDLRMAYMAAETAKKKS